jgi:hypothetical protein
MALPGSGRAPVVVRVLWRHRISELVEHLDGVERSFGPLSAHSEIVSQADSMAERFLHEHSRIGVRRHVVAPSANAQRVEELREVLSHRRHGLLGVRPSVMPLQVAGLASTVVDTTELRP